jgi:hypothetical protein
MNVVENEEEWFKGAYLNLGGFYTYADKLASSIIVSDISDKIL